MIYTLSKNQVQELLHKPETGMGYQVIEAKKATSYFSDKLIVLNSELVIDMDAQHDRFLKQAFTEGLEKIKLHSQLIQLSAIRVLSRHEAFGNVVNESKSAKEKGAKEKPKEPASGFEVFARLSAYFDDKRVDKVNKRLLPGSYSTTLMDYLRCKKNDLDPVDRYALPNDEPVKWAFHLTPIEGDMLQRGISPPANGHNGGGEEIFFEDGTSLNTVLNNGVPFPY